MIIMSKKCTWIVKRTPLSVMNWPPQSLDVNVIEAVSNHLSRKWSKRKTTYKEELRILWKKPREIFLKITY